MLSVKLVEKMFFAWVYSINCTPRSAQRLLRCYNGFILCFGKTRLGLLQELTAPQQGPVGPAQYFCQCDDIVGHVAEGILLLQCGEL